MRSETPGNAGPQAADAAHDQVDLARRRRDARYSAWITAGSVSALSLAMMRAGRPARACSASRSIFAISARCRLNGACSSLRSRGTRVSPVSCRKISWMSSPISSSAVSRP